MLGRVRAHTGAHARAWPGMPVQQRTPPGLGQRALGCGGSVHGFTGVALGRAHRLVFRRVAGHTIKRIIQGHIYNQAVVVFEHTGAE